MPNNTGALSAVTVEIQGDAASSYSNWTTAVPPTSGEHGFLLPLISEGIERNESKPDDNTLLGTLARTSHDRGTKSNSGDIGCNLVLDTSDSVSAPNPIPLLYAAMGGYAFDSTSEAERHQLTIDDMALIAFTAHSRKGQSAGANSIIKQLTGGLIDSFTLSGDISGEAQINFSTRGYGWEVLSTGQLGYDNAIEAFAKNGYSRLMGFDLDFRISDTLNTPLDGDDSVIINNYSLSFNRNMSADEYGTTDSNHTDSRNPILPVIGDKRVVEFTFDLPRTDDTQFMTWAEDKTSLQAELKWELPSGYYFRIIIPNMAIDNVSDPTSGAGAITQSVTATLATRDSSQTTGNSTFNDGTTDVEKEFGIEIYDANASAYTFTS